MEVEEPPRVKADVPDSAAEVERRGLVRRDNGCTSRHKGVGWHKKSKKWKARIERGEKQERLGSFATEEEAKARRDARCRELGVDPDARASSGFRGVDWHKGKRKWQAQIKVDGKNKHLGLFEAPARGEVDAALAYDAAVRAAGRPETANFEPVLRGALPTAPPTAPPAAVGSIAAAAAAAETDSDDDWL